MRLYLSKYITVNNVPFYPKRFKNSSLFTIFADLIRDLSRDFRAYTLATVSFMNKLITCGENLTKI